MTAINAPNPPLEWVGSRPEWNVYWALTQLGKKPDQDFYFQSPQMGGRMTLGGVVVDFYLPAEGLAIEVQSSYYHYQAYESKIEDIRNREQLELLGVHVVYIDEDDTLTNPVYYVSEALKGNDHSWLG
jgi:hypothetical protein